MGPKYRIRLQNDRLIGPFSSEEVAELFEKKHINGQELCQQFPIGDWKKISQFPSLAPLLTVTKNPDPEILSPTTPLVNPSSTSSELDIKGLAKAPTEKTQSGIKTFKEFKFGNDISIDVNYDDLEKKYQEMVKDEDVESELEKTRLIRNASTSEVSDQDKTIIVPSKAERPTKDAKIPEVIDNKNLTHSSHNQKQLSTHEIMNEKTEFINLNSVLPSINAELKASEVELEQKARIEVNQDRQRQKELEAKKELARAEEEEFELEEDEDTGFLKQKIKPEKKKKKKGMSMIVAISFLAVFYVLLTPDEKPKASGPQYLEVKFPITQDEVDSAGAASSLSAGRVQYAKNTYANRSMATKYYLNSLQKKFSGNEAMGELILTYAELYDETKDPKASANILYKLIQLSENKMLSDLSTVTGTAFFYGKIGKYQTGINLIKNYMRAKGAISSKLLAYYLDLLISAGELVEAKKTFIKLSETPKKPFEAYYYLARFYEVDDQLAEARTTIEEGLKFYPDSVMLLLKYADYLFKEQNNSKFEEVLKKCDKLKVEGSPSYAAKLFYHLGLLSALKNKNKEATAYFKRSLNIKESDDLRSMLSSLEISGDKFSKALILESKVIDLIKRANAELKNKNLEAAFTFSIEAIDADPNYVPAILLHTKLQLRRGLFSSAIDNLQKAINNNPTNYTLKRTLIETYLKSFKLDEAQKALIELSQTKYSVRPEFASLMADNYFAKQNINLALKWYNEALVRDPLSDYDMFQVAKIFFRLKKFNDARNRLSKALLLDPKNSDYLAMNAEILFEQDNTDTALGYLRDAIAEVGEDAKLVSTIAMLYYKSGQLKEFQSYYKKIQNLSKKEESFYEFLIKAAKLEEKKEDYVTYSRELLKLNPGNLKVRLDLGEFFYENKRYSDAISEFEEIKDKLTSYPKVHFMLAKVYLTTGDIKKAKEMAKKELQLNPGLDSAYYISGEVFRSEKDFREAVLMYEKAISLNPKSAEALMSMAWIRLAQNYASEAIELYNRALKEEPSNPEIHKQMGYAYKAAGQRAMAKEKFEDYLKLSPGAADKDQTEALIRSLQ